MFFPRITAGRGLTLFLFLWLATVFTALAVDPPTVRDGSHCGTGPVTLTAFGASDGNYRWYTSDNDAGLINGAWAGEYITPFISANAIYYVAIASGTEVSARVPVNAWIDLTPRPLQTFSTSALHGPFTWFNFVGNTNDVSATTPPNNGVPTDITFSDDRFGRPNGAAAFNGTTSLVTTTTQYTTPNVFSLALWFKTGSTTAGGSKLIGWAAGQTGAEGNHDRHILIDAAGRLTFGVYNNFNLTLRSAAGVPYNDNAWHFVVATMGADGMKFYVDNVLAGSNTNTAGEAHPGYWRIGNGTGWAGFGGTGGVGFEGNMDDVKIYQRALTASEISELYTTNNDPFVDVITPNRCDNPGPAQVYVWNTEPGTIYQMLNYPGNTSSGNEVIGDGGRIILSSDDVNATRSFRVRVSSPHKACFQLNSVVIRIPGGASPAAPVSRSTTICGESAATLTAAGETGAKYRWFLASDPGTILDTNATYTTAVLSSNTSTVYGVQQVNTAGCVSTTTFDTVTAKNSPVVYLDPVINTGLALKIPFTYPLTETTGTVPVTGINDVTTSHLGFNRSNLAGTAASFNGTSDYISLTTQTTLVAPFAYSIWVRSTDAEGGEIVAFENADATRGIHTFLNNAGRVVTAAYSAGAWKLVSSGEIVNDGKWHNIQVTLNAAAGLNLYVDGNLSATDASANTFPAVAGNWTFGKARIESIAGVPAGTDPYFTGFESDFRLYSRDLTAAEMGQLAHQGVISTNQRSQCGVSGATAHVALLSYDTRYQYIFYAVNGNTLTPINTVTAGDSMYFSNFPLAVGNNVFRVASFDPVSACNFFIGNDIVFNTGSVPASPTIADADQGICGGGGYAVRPAGGTAGHYRFYDSETSLVPVSAADFVTGNVLIGQTVKYWISVVNDQGCESPRLAVMVKGKIIPSDPGVTEFFPTNGLMALYKFNSNTLDESGTGNHAVWGSTTTTPVYADNHKGVPSSALTFNAANTTSLTNGEFLNTSSLVTRPDTFSYNVWVKTTSAVPAALISFSGGQNGLDAGGNDRHLWMTATGVVRFGVWNGGIKGVTSTSRINDGEWHMVTATIGTRGIFIYVDGRQEATFPYWQPEARNGYFHLAGYQLSNAWQAGAATSFTGTLDDIVIYNRQLTTTEVALLYNNDALQLNPSQVCGTAGKVKLTIFQPASNFDYQLIHASTGTPASPLVHVNGIPESIEVWSNLLSADTDLKVVISNDGDCGVTLGVTYHVTVTPASPRPTVVDSVNCTPGPGSVTAIGGSEGHYRWWRGADKLNLALIAGANSASVQTLISAPGQAETLWVATFTDAGCVSDTIRVIARNANPVQGIGRYNIDKLTLWYDMDGSLADKAGKVPANPGLAQGAFGGIPGLRDTTDAGGHDRHAYSFNGIDNYIQTTNSYNNPMRFSIGINFRTTAPGGILWTCMGSPTGGGGGYDRICYLGPTGKIHFGIYDQGYKMVNSALSYNDGLWHSVLVTVDSLGGSYPITMYVDGYLIDMNAASVNGPEGRANAYWIIGNGTAGGGWTDHPAATNQFWTGELDEFFFANHTILTPSVSLSHAAGVDVTTGPTNFCETDENQSWIRFGSTQPGVTYEILENGVVTGSYAAPGVPAPDDTLLIPVTIDRTKQVTIRGTNVASGCSRMMEETYFFTKRPPRPDVEYWSNDAFMTGHSNSTDSLIYNWYQIVPSFIPGTFDTVLVASTLVPTYFFNSNNPDTCYCLRTQSVAAPCSSEASANVVCPPVRIRPRNISAEIGLFPNPNAGKLALSLPAYLNGVKEIVVSDQLGRQLRKFSTTLTGNFDVNLADLSNGMYHITVISGNARAVKPFVISK
ncbi:MAG: LamG-like jellyroll fold domain-containing protein [Bacteroidota bacterium]